MRGRRGHRHKLILIAALAVTVASTAACSSGGSDLVGKTFTSTSTQGHTLVSGTTVELTFTESGISATAGCNTLVGRATWDDGTLRASDLASTMMGCDDDLHTQDQWLTDLLTSSPSISLSGSVLTVGGASMGAVFEETSA